MKFLNKLFILVLVLGVASCNMTDLDLQDNPNAVSPDQANPNDLFNNIQLNTASFFQGTWGFTGSVTRMRNWTGGFTYNDAFRATNFDGLWTTAYA
ncbi:MAG: SusD/RagB family nutrient-binding outer membrane lipoprotein, partial [Bacteroidetes bacterium]